tara:strand:+ start:529 stop:819 length:291 start_codon:yes stop_codon:yes gene_type:complete
MNFTGGYSSYQVVMSHLFTIPFRVLKNDRLQRFPNWNDALHEDTWRRSFLGRKLTRFRDNFYENNFYLEFEGQHALLTNRKLVTLYKNKEQYRFGK